MHTYVNVLETYNPYSENFCVSQRKIITMDFHFRGDLSRELRKDCKKIKKNVAVHLTVNGKKSNFQIDFSFFFWEEA